MIWIFPIAGRGTRVKRLGKFKPFIDVYGEKIIQWCIKGIKHKFTKNDKFIFITTKSFEMEFNVEETLEGIFQNEKIFNKIQIILSDKTPQGPAASIYLSKKSLPEEEQCTIVNADQYVDFDTKPDILKNEAFLPLYFNNTGKSSYVEIKKGEIIAIHEKWMKTFYASSGVYSFGSTNLLIDVIEDCFKKKMLVNNEYYIGPAMNSIIDFGGKIYPTQTLVKFDLGSINGIERLKQLLDMSIKK